LILVNQAKIARSWTGLAILCRTDGWRLHVAPCNRLVRLREEQGGVTIGILTEDRAAWQSVHAATIAQTVRIGSRLQRQVVAVEAKPDRHDRATGDRGHDRVDRGLRALIDH